ncbi:uncharacterized protein PG998_002909 [Apiospora kogelbergensis]|uniref:uncharacterized protein n=1 Tax=Apiospora kogelbergensis TaxID=1337665 RepID=UPI0031317F0B
MFQQTKASATHQFAVKDLPLQKHGQEIDLSSTSHRALQVDNSSSFEHNDLLDRFAMKYTPGVGLKNYARGWLWLALGFILWQSGHPKHGLPGNLSKEPLIGLLIASIVSLKLPTPTAYEQNVLPNADSQATQAKPYSAIHSSKRQHQASRPENAETLHPEMRLETGMRLETVLRLETADTGDESSDDSGDDKPTEGKSL